MAKRQNIYILLIIISAHVGGPKDISLMCVNIYKAVVVCIAETHTPMRSPGKGQSGMEQSAKSIRLLSLELATPIYITDP